MEREDLQLRIEVDLGDEADPAELSEETARLREELLRCDVETVERTADGAPPPGTRAVELALAGTLLVGLGKEAMARVVAAIGDWASRRSDRSVKLVLGDDSIELGRASKEDQEQLLEMFLSRHASPEP